MDEEYIQGEIDPVNFDPVLSNLLMQYMLLKVGGQITIDLLDVAQMQKDYLGTRIAFDRSTNIMVLTLRSLEGESDRPTGDENDRPTEDNDRPE